MSYFRAGLSVLQPWVEDLTYMQQTVLLTAIRGPDSIRKDHVSKKLCRWLRRCILLSAFDRDVLNNPYDPRGGSFTGPSIGPYTNKHVDWPDEMNEIVTDYLRTIDELPHHFQLHFIHATEILGYKHPDTITASWWYSTYLRLVNDMHLLPESEIQMDKRLGDNREAWLSAEEVTAR